MTFATSLTLSSRFQGTKAAAASKPAAKKGDWRKKREEFINALRAAKERKTALDYNDDIYAKFRDVTKI